MAGYLGKQPPKNEWCSNSVPCELVEIIWLSRILRYSCILVDSFCGFRESPLRLSYLENTRNDQRKTHEPRVTLPAGARQGQVRLSAQVSPGVSLSRRY